MNKNRWLFFYVKIKAFTDFFAGFRCNWSQLVDFCWVGQFLLFLVEKCELYNFMVSVGIKWATGGEIFWFHRRCNVIASWLKSWDSDLESFLMSPSISADNCSSGVDFWNYFGLDLWPLRQNSIVTLIIDDRVLVAFLILLFQRGQEGWMADSLNSNALTSWTVCYEEIMVQCEWISARRRLFSSFPLSPFTFFSWSLPSPVILWAFSTQNNLLPCTPWFIIIVIWAFSSLNSIFPRFRLSDGNR